MMRMTNTSTCKLTVILNTRAFKYINFVYKTLMTTLFTAADFISLVQELSCSAINLCVRKTNTDATQNETNSKQNASAKEGKKKRWENSVYFTM